MKCLFIFFCLLAALQSKAANDTLTRAQVYNFNVGDTFDYRILTIYQSTPDGGGMNFYDEYFKRVIVNEVQYFPLDSSIVITELLYQVLSNNEFLSQGSLIFGFDSSHNYAFADAYNVGNCNGLCSIAFDTGYNQRVTNEAVFCGGLGCWAQDVTFASGLGLTNTYIYWSDGGQTSEEWDTTLIYYSKSGETWGTPATIVAGIPNINQQNSIINLFPTFNSGQFTLEADADNSSGYQLNIYDLAGREIKKVPINNGTNNIELNTSAGMYLWSVMREGQLLKSGKLIIQ